MNDTKCLLGINSSLDTQNFSTDLDTIGAWVEKWNMLFNEEKFARVWFVLNFESVAPLLFSINRSTITNCDHYRNFGVVMSNNLSWYKHCHCIASKAHKSVGTIRRAFKTNCILLNARYIYHSFAPIYLSAVQSNDHIIHGYCLSIKGSETSCSTHFKWISLGLYSLVLFLCTFSLLCTTLSYLRSDVLHLKIQICIWQFKHQRLHHLLQLCMAPGFLPTASWDTTNDHHHHIDEST